LNPGKLRASSVTGSGIKRKGGIVFIRITPLAAAYQRLKLGRAVQADDPEAAFVR